MIKKLFLVAFVLLSVKMSVAYASNNIPPVLENFRIKVTEPSRIYFDSNEPITASTVTGFILNDNTITNVSINAGQLLNHYFTVSSSFKWFNHNSIRYIGGSNFQNENSIALSKFDLQYIENKIVPIEGTSNIYYVDASVNNSGNGSSEANAFKTIQEAVDVARAGSKVWIKTGNYGNENINFQRGGTASNPITFEGYINQIGDISSMYFNYENGDQIDASMMPLLDGGNRNVGRAMNFNAAIGFIILRNIQITNYSEGLRTKSIKGVLLENIIVKDIGDVNKNRGLAIHFSSASNKASYNKFSNCIVINATAQAFKLGGQNNLIEDCKAYSDEAFDFRDKNATTDYYFLIRGNSNIVRKSLAHKNTLNGAGHLGHGFALKASDTQCEYNLIESNTSINIYGAYEARHPEVKFNVFKNLISHADVSNRRSSNTGSAAINILQGAESNIFERIYGHHLDVAIRFGDNTEDNTHVSGRNNVIKNCVFDNIKAVVLASNVSRDTSRPSGNKIYNSTFNNADFLYNISNSSDPIVFSNNEWKNNIFNNIRVLDNPRGNQSSGWSYSTNNFFDNGFTKPSGSGNTSVDPKFVNITAGDFKLADDSPMIDSGLDINSVTIDFEGNSRLQGAGMDIGAYEYEDATISSINVNAGPDVEICSGEDVVLTATGNGDFLWDTGETTPSITVNPSETTTYTITVTDPNTNESETDTVTVTVEEAPSVVLEEDISICLGENIVLTATGNGNFLWSTGETTPSITVNPTSTITYSVVASNSCSTTATDDITVTVNSGVNLNAGNDITICLGDSITLLANSLGDFLWNTGETTSNITVSPTTTTTYTVISTLGSCSVSDEVVVTVEAIPSVTLGDDITLCSEEESITLTAEGVGSFLWSTGETTPSITVNPTSTITYSVVASNSCSTTATDDITVTVNPGVNLDAGNDITICFGDNVTLSANSSGDFLWSTGETTANITVSPITTTTYMVTSSLGSCSVSDEVVVTVEAVPSVALGDDITLCSGEESVTLTAVGVGNFLWSTGETTSSIIVYPTSTTTYTVTANSCNTSVSDEIIVNVTEEIVLDAGEDILFCPGESVTLTAEGIGNFLWSTGETTASITVNPSVTTTYIVTSTVGSCSVSDQVTAMITASPSVNINGNDIIVCSTEEEIVLRAEGNGDFLWSTGEITSSITVYPTVTDTYSVTITNTCGEVATDEILISVNEPVIAYAGEDIVINEGYSVVLTASGGGEYLWSTGETTESIIVNPTVETIYYVEVSKNGCSDTDAVKVTVDEAVVMINNGLDITICEGENVALEAKGGVNYLWSTGEITSAIQASPQETTTYYVSALRDGVIQTAEITIYVNDCSGNGNNRISNLNVYPNPTEGLINVFLPDLREKVRLSLVSLNGSLIYNKEVKADNNGVFTQIDLSNMAKGVYFLRMYNKNFNETKKILVI